MKDVTKSKIKKQTEKKKKKKRKEEEKIRETLTESAKPKN